MSVSASGSRTPRERAFIFFNDTATTEIYTHSLHDALPICALGHRRLRVVLVHHREVEEDVLLLGEHAAQAVLHDRSEEHTSELQSRQYLVCRLLLEKKKNASALERR